MSPTSRELVINKGLSGQELSTIIKSDLNRLLEGHGLLASSVISFRRVSYELRLTLHLDNPFMPHSTDSLRSRLSSQSEVESHPELAAIEASLPLPSSSPQAMLTSDELSRKIDSPNVARLEHGLPIAVSTKDQDGHTQENLVQYPSQYPGLVTIPPVIKDVTSSTRAELKMPPDPEADAVMAEIRNEGANDELVAGESSSVAEADSTGVGESLPSPFNSPEEAR